MTHYARVHSVINQKGGVGKTSTAINLSYGLAKQGFETLLIDMDSQANSSPIFLLDTPDTNETIKRALEEKDFKIQRVIKKAYLEGEVVPHLYIIPSSVHLAVTAEQIIFRKHKEKLLHKKLNTIKNQFDFIIIDCPPSLGSLTVNAIYAADNLIIPTDYGKNALDGIADLFQTIEDVKEDDIYTYKILRNEYDSRTKKTNVIVNETLESYEDNMFKTIIRKSESINQSHFNEEPVFTFDPNGNGATDYKNLVNEFIKLEQKQHTNTTDNSKKEAESEELING